MNIQDTLCSWSTSWIKSVLGLTILPGNPLDVLVNNQLDAQFFHVCLYPLHVSGSHVPIIRRIVVSVRHLVYVTLCKQLSCRHDFT